MGHARHPFLHDMPAIRWIMVLCACLGLWGQLLIESRSLPGELPRSTIMRLTGIDIAPMPHMADMPQADASHDTMMEDMGPGHTDPMDQPGHDHTEGCPLCPLLHLPALVLTVLPFVPLPPVTWARPRHALSQPRAPPPVILGLPPAQGPPSVS